MQRGMYCVGTSKKTIYICKVKSEKLQIYKPERCKNCKFEGRLRVVSLWNAIVKTGPGADNTIFAGNSYTWRMQQSSWPLCRHFYFCLSFSAVSQTTIESVLVLLAGFFVINVKRFAHLQFLAVCSNSTVL